MEHIKTLIVKIVIPFFKNTLVNVIQNEGAKAIQTYLDKINKFVEKLETRDEIINQYLQMLIS